MNSRAPFVQGSTTSEGGSSFITPKRTNIAQRIFIHLGGGGRTCAEVEKDLGLKHQTASARFTELVSSGCICTAGYVRGKPPSEVYVPVPGATFDLFRAWQKEEDEPSSGPRSHELPIEVVAAVREAFETVRNTIDEHELETARDRLWRSVVRHA